MNWYKICQQLQFPFHTTEDENIARQQSQQREMHDLLSEVSVIDYST